MRPVEAGLGGHDAGVLEVDAGVEEASLPIRKRGRVSWSGCTIISDFVGVENDHVGEK